MSLPLAHKSPYTITISSRSGTFYETIFFLSGDVNYKFQIEFYKKEKVAHTALCLKLSLSFRFTIRCPLNMG